MFLRVEQLSFENRELANKLSILSTDISSKEAKIKVLEEEIEKQIGIIHH